ncbi:polysaccharide biosynthesis/export family protein [Aurantimonas sp. Leaf443]|uniref:polysaccharide biosynthesis/export family protein n=1 Tax=Aurantimonas sp. Leaf443 TaxID=1736378 RepID=UPI0006FBE4F9|nr:polysaccharide biosynthesis/export family protein [Aurantimonas sp. Leaf443]KQT88375.1 hypothetical protein ASG48_02840 [Aurantimonas sp. Leaf443]
MVAKRAGERPAASPGGRRRGALLAAFLAAGLLPCLAPATALGAGTAAGVPDEAYLLAPGDRVTVTIFDQPDVSGTYLVEPTGTITMPLLGSVDVREMTPKGLQADLVTRFSEGYLQNPVVNVRLAELRPFTIVGGVRAPGRYAYVDGLTVETALALAGGLSRLSGDDLSQRSDFLQTDERLKALTIGYLSQLARKARLEAQLKGETEITLPRVGAPEREALEGLVEGEREILSFETVSQKRQIDLLAQQSRQLEAEIQSFEEQADLQKEQIAFIDDQIKDFQSLLVNGLTKKSAVIDLQREKSKSRSDLSRILSDLSRSRSTLAEARLKLDELDTSYRSKLMADLQDTRLRLAESESGLPLVAETRQLKLERMPGAMDSANAPLTMKISRYRAGAIDSFEAQATTVLWPGDILQVGGASGAQPASGGNDLRLPAAGTPSPAEEPAPRRESMPDRLSQR